MRDGERLAVHLEGARVVARLVASETEERHNPGIARDGGSEVVLREPGEAMLEHSPQRAGIGEGGGDFVGEVAPRLQPKVGGFLAGQITGDELVKQLWSEEAAFNSDGREGGHVSGVV